MNRANQFKETKKMSAELIAKYPKISSLDRDSRGLPIPANVRYNPTSGRPVFSGTQFEKEIELLCDGRCVVTGARFEIDDIWFISTPDMVLYPFGQCVDGPVCGEAKDFSLQVCPYFSIRNYKNLSSEQKDKIFQDGQGIDPVNTSMQPTRFAAVCVPGFVVNPTDRGMRYIPSRKYSKIEFWKEGSCESIIEGAKIGALIGEYFKIADGKTNKDRWPGWAQASCSEEFNGKWPWIVPGARTILLEAMQRVFAEGT